MFSCSCSDIYIFGLMEFVMFWKWLMGMSKLFWKCEFSTVAPLWLCSGSCQQLFCFFCSAKLPQPSRTVPSLSTDLAVKSDC